MEHRSGSQIPLSFILLCILCSRTLALPPLESSSAMRLGNRMLFDGASESDQAQGSLKREADILQTALPDNDKLYFDVSRAIDRNTRHSDGIFTSEYSKLLGQIFARKYLESIVGKRVNNCPIEESMPVKRHSDGVFTNDYSRLRKQIAAQKYLNSVLAGKRSSQKELNTDNLPDETELLDPVFSEIYDDLP
ncbi:VIP peptides isoform X1 [Paroedura picta]|uniref:VIP peptides isoform X1 n=1 Tax=Paroedura picta TaxID=143630 RepID=UPI0010148BAE